MEGGFALKNHRPISLLGPSLVNRLKQRLLFIISKVLGAFVDHHQGLDTALSLMNVMILNAKAINRVSCVSWIFEGL